MSAVSVEESSGLPSEVRGEIEAILAETERSTLSVGTCLGEILQQAEGFVGEIKENIGAIASDDDDSASATLDDQYASVSSFLAQLRSGVGEQAEAADQVLRSSGLVSKAAQEVEDIAVNTKMLCINTMIEASRLGDMGKPVTVIADEMRQLSGSIARSNQQIKDVTNQLAVLLERVKTNISAIGGSTDQFAGQFDQQRGKIERVTAGLREATKSTMTAGDERLAVILERSAKSLQDLQSQDIVAQRLRRILQMLDGEQVGDAPKFAGESPSDITVWGDDDDFGADGDGGAQSGQDGDSEGMKSGDVQMF